MNSELRARIIAYNKTVAAHKEKAEDLDVIVSQILKLPPGQIKKVLTAEVIAVLEKYGFGKDTEE